MKFTAFERTEQGTGASRRLRNAGKCPGIVYGGSEPAQMIELDHNALWYALLEERFHSSILDMKLNGESSRVFIKSVQYHPYKQQVLHIDFQRVDAGKPIQILIPLHYKGEEDSPAVKLGGQIVNIIRTEIEITCLPKDLPEMIEVDLSNLEDDQVLHISDIPFPEGVTAYGYSDEVDPAIVTTGAPRIAISTDDEEGEEEGDVADDSSAEEESTDD